MNRHKKWKTRTPDFEHILCPDRSTFDLFLAEYFHFLSRRLHKALACCEGVPAWLRFLESIKLIDFDLRKRTYRAISKLYSQMERLVNDHTPKDDYLLHELEKAWSDPDM